MLSVIFDLSFVTVITITRDNRIYGCHSWKFLLYLNAAHFALLGRLRPVAWTDVNSVKQCP